MLPRHRRCLVLRGSMLETRQRALEIARSLDPEGVLWVSEEASEETAPFEPVPFSKVRDRLGRSFDAVVLDMTQKLDADVLGQCHGFVWGGGALVLRLPARGDVPAEGKEGLAAHPYEAGDVGDRLWMHVEDTFEHADTAEPEALTPAPHDVQGTDEQVNAVDRLAAAFLGEAPVRIALLADRGRGKSSALGMALRRYLDAGHDDEPPNAVVTARHPDAAGEVFDFAFDEHESGESTHLPFVRAPELVRGDREPEVIVVDEAAQLSVPLLKRLVERHSEARFAFASTIHGYEGTGRGFSLRFLEWLREQSVPLEVRELEEPIRWADDDPLEQRVFDALLLDAEPASFDEPPDVIDRIEHVRLDRDVLVRRPERLRQFFGLLVQAHYRTTPSDLHRMLDAPNLNLHALLHDGRIAAATWVAEEGGLSDEICNDLYWGRQRILGHALPETCTTHLGHRHVGRMKMMRSVRIAVHPDLRRRGLGSRLVEAVHRTYDPDLFGTLFGATPGLLRFRRSVGYEVIRMGVSRGSRTGSPSVAMMRPVSPWARDLFERMRRELALTLPAQLELVQAGGALPIEPSLRKSLRRGLPSVEPLSEERRREIVAQFAWGPRTYESAAFAIEPFVEAHDDLLDALDETHRRLVEAKVVERLAWSETTERASLESVSAAMRVLREAIRGIAERTMPDRAPEG